MENLNPKFYWGLKYENMSVSLISGFPRGFTLIKNFRGAGRFRLYGKGNSYACSMIIPWFRKFPIWIKIDASQEELRSRRRSPLGLHPEQAAEFDILLAKTCQKINEDICAGKTWVNHLLVEEVAMVFWAKQVTWWVTSRKWSLASNLYYSLAQILYVCFGIIVEKIMVY